MSALNPSALAESAHAAAFQVSIDWGSFVLVFGVALAAAVVIVVAYSLALRLLAVGSADDTGPEGAVVVSARGNRPAIATVGGVVCLAIGVGAVLFGLYLAIPQFH
jgi:hypothetical protein